MNWEDLKFFLAMARTEQLKSAARFLSVDISTVSRRLRKLELELDTQLFTRSMNGHSLTEYGQLLLQSALKIEQQANYARETIQGKNLEDWGCITIGATEAFGSFFLAPRLAKFAATHPGLLIELLPLPRFTRLTKHEADMSVSIEKGNVSTLIVTKLCDYRVKMYASRKYLECNEPINNLKAIHGHFLIGYISNLAFSDQLQYIDQVLPGHRPVFSSTSVVAQYMAVKDGLGLAFLPCFLARHCTDLIPVLENDIDLIKTFWLLAHPDQKKITRVNKVWNFLREIVAEDVDVLMDR